MIFQHFGDGLPEMARRRILTAGIFKRERRRKREYFVAGELEEGRFESLSGDNNGTFIAATTR